MCVRCIVECALHMFEFTHLFEWKILFSTFKCWQCCTLISKYSIMSADFKLVSYSYFLWGWIQYWIKDRRSFPCHFNAPSEIRSSLTFKGAGGSYFFIFQHKRNVTTTYKHKICRYALCTCAAPSAKVSINNARIFKRTFGSACEQRICCGAKFSIYKCFCDEISMLPDDCICLALAVGLPSLSQSQSL